MQHGKLFGGNCHLVNCPHATPISAHANACALGLHGGRPSKGTCAHCIERGENTPDHAAQVKAAPPTLPQQAASLGKSLVNWTASGFSPTPPDILAARESTCRACPEWDAAAMGGTGRCRICKCSTWAKIRMATERCPIGKWESVPSLTEPKN
jgi:hypothetical protein